MESFIYSIDCLGKVVLRHSLAGTEAAEGVHKEGLRNWLLLETLSLLNQYPGGVSKAVACTHLVGLLKQKKAKERSRSGSHNESKHAYEAIQSLKHRNNEGTFCLEARIDSVKQIAGQPAITMLSDGEAKHSSIEAYLPFPISRQEDGRFWIRSGQRLRLAGCRYVKRSGVLHDMVIASKCMAVCVGSPKEAESLLNLPLCSPAQIAQIPGMEGSEQQALGLLHGIVKKGLILQGASSLWLGDPFPGNEEFTLSLQLSPQQESITGIINEGEHVYISNVKVTKQGQGNLPILRLALNSVICTGSKSPNPDNASLDKENRIGQSQYFPGRNVAVPDSSESIFGEILSIGKEGLEPSIILTIQGKERLSTVNLQLSKQTEKFLRTCEAGHVVSIIGDQYPEKQVSSIWSLHSNCSAGATGSSNGNGHGISIGEGCAADNYFWQAGPGGSAMSLTASLGLLNSPFLSEAVSPITSKKSFAQGIISRISDLSFFRIHKVCERPVECVALSLEDFFERDLPPGKAEQPVKNQNQIIWNQGTSGNNAAEGLSKDDADSFYQCSFCAEECTALNVAPSMSLMLDMTTTNGEVIHARASGTAAEDILGATSSTLAAQQTKSLQRHLDRVLHHKAKALLFRKQQSGDSSELQIGRLVMQ